MTHLLHVAIDTRPDTGRDLVVERRTKGDAPSMTHLLHVAIDTRPDTGRDLVVESAVR